MGKLNSWYIRTSSYGVLYCSLLLRTTRIVIHFYWVISWYNINNTWPKLWREESANRRMSCTNLCKYFVQAKMHWVALFRIADELPCINPLLRGVHNRETAILFTITDHLLSFGFWTMNGVVGNASKAYLNIIDMYDKAAELTMCLLLCYHLSENEMFRNHLSLIAHNQRRVSHFSQFL